MESSNRVSSPVVQKIVVRKDLNMRKGKIAAQVAHASNSPIMELLQQSLILMNRLPESTHNCRDSDYMKFVEKFHKYNHIVTEWKYSGSTKIVLGCDSKDQLVELINKGKSLNIPTYPIVDYGLTEFHGVNTLTCCAFGPYYRDQIDEITNSLNLI